MKWAPIPDRFTRAAFARCPTPRNYNASTLKQKVSNFRVICHVIHHSRLLIRDGMRPREINHPTPAIKRWTQLSGWISGDLGLSSSSLLVCSFLSFSCCFFLKTVVRERRYSCWLVNKLATFESQIRTKFVANFCNFFSNQSFFSLNVLFF